MLITGLLSLSFILFWGGGPDQHHVLGFHYWKEPGSFKSQLSPGSAGYFVAFLATLISSVLPFTFSPEMIVVAAGEVQSPRRNLPRISNRFFWRLIVFYIGGVIAISIICPSNAAQLKSGQSGAGSSPWVAGIENAGIKGLDSVVNAVIITAAWSAGNSFLYLASRSLYSLALAGDAPKFFARTNNDGTPINAVIASSLFALLAYMNVNSSAANVFNWLLNMVNTGGFISWVCCAIVYIRFRKACLFQGVASPFHSRVQPLGSYITGVAFAILCLANGFTVFWPSAWSASSFLTAYVGLPLFTVIYVGHRIYCWNDKWAIPVEEVDLTTGLDEIEASDVPHPEPKNLFEKVMNILV
jgi:amino acid transporter